MTDRRKLSVYANSPGEDTYTITSIPFWPKAPRLGEPHATDCKCTCMSVGLCAEVKEVRLLPGSDLLLPGTRQRRATQSLRKPLGGLNVFVINFYVLCSM